MTIESSREYAPLVDILRFLAALSVLGFHLAGTWPHGFEEAEIYRGYPDVARFTDFTYAGFVGVEIFFVISGYVISQSALGRSAKSFFVGRSLRILPVLWISTVVSLAIHIALGAPVMATLAGAIRNGVLFPAGGWLDGVVWTLTVEAAFYGLVFLCLLVSRGRPTPNLVIAAWVLATISTSYNATLYLMSQTNGHYLPSILLLNHGALFALGMSIWCFSRNIASMRWLMPLAFVGSVMEIANRVHLYAVEGGMRSVVLPVLLFTAGVALTLIGALHTRNRLTPVVRTLGLVTYPLYLLHSIVGGAVVLICVQLDMSVGVALTAGLSAALATSWLIVALIEPIIRPIAKQALEAVADTLDWSDPVGRRADEPR